MKKILISIVKWFKGNRALAITKIILLSLFVLPIVAFVIANFGISKLKYFNIIVLSISGLSLLTFVIIKIIVNNKEK